MAKHKKKRRKKVNKPKTRLELIRERWKKMQGARIALQDEELDDDGSDEEDAELHPGLDLLCILWPEAASRMA